MKVCHPWMHAQRHPAMGETNYVLLGRILFDHLKVAALDTMIDIQPSTLVPQVKIVVIVMI